MAILSSPVRLWSLPSAILLVALSIWGALRYPHLPERIPMHLGSDGVDTWTDKSIGSAFVLVFVYAGATLVMAGSAELTLRLTPRDELTATDTTSFAASSLVNRPRSHASALRIARAVWLLNACIGITMLAGCALLWHSTPDLDIPGWLPVAFLAPILAGTAVLIAAAVRDRKG
ncbi:DUF1648 domain-containing protein [Streptomyces rimosus]|uniref:DUF1648 domain-containing protein n=1 Tax=Streptomyces rimosus TaxID=1927 RepID=UPI0004C9FFE5|nr:DUF1648 domain-containing protein [Streptomyces rimosus]